MAQRLIFYTSQAEGITIGVQGETWMECLLALSEEFGEGLLPLYEKTREELADLSAAVADTYSEELEGISEEIGKAVIRQQEQDSAKTQRAAVKDFLDEDSEPPPVWPADSGARQTSLDADAAVRDAGGSGDDSPTCTICGNTTTKDFATLTRLDHGEVRCPDCTP